jgi:BMFP domain-containing protein YqiC
MNPIPFRNSTHSQQVDRRRFLANLGVAVSLPLLPSLFSKAARAATTGTAPTGAATTASGAPLRMAFMSHPNGVQQDHWFPKGTGRDFELNNTMLSLEPVKEHLQIIAGLKHENATAGADGPGDHARASATFLTGARARKTAGKDIHVGISVDQVAAQSYGRQTRFPSLELTCDSIRNSGSCDSGYACAYQYNLSWSSATTPVTPEANPRAVFERLFGAGDAAEREKNYKMRQQTERSVLDFVMEETSDVRGKLAQDDRQKLDEYLSVVRELEVRIKSAETAGNVPAIERETPVGIPGDFAAHMDLMYDMLLLAFQTDATRVGTLILAYDGSNRVFKQIDIPEGHHYLTHNQRKDDLATKVAKIDAYYLECFSRFLQKMEDTKDVDGNSLLHNSMIVYGGAISDGNRHLHDNLPCILAGHAGGKLQPGRYLRVPEQPMANLFVSMLNHTGVPTKQFGDSTARLEDVM